MHDLSPAASLMATLLTGIRDDQLGAPTPCPDYTLGDLVDHVGGLALAFTAAARKTSPAGGPSGDASRLPPDWRTVFGERLAELAVAWRDPGAWDGMTQAGGIDLPGEVAGRVALNELVVHGWDVARASGQAYAASDDSIAGALEFVSTFPPDGPEREGLFGPALDAPAAASPLHRLIALTGRDPAWSAP